MSKSADLMRLKSISNAVRSGEGTIIALLQFLCEQVIDIKEELNKLIEKK